MQPSHVVVIVDDQHSFLHVFKGLQDTRRA
jgi:hypothetical protein